MMTNPDRQGGSNIPVRVAQYSPVHAPPLMNMNRPPRDDLSSNIYLRPATSFHHPSDYNRYLPPNPELFSQDFLRNYSVNAQNREFFMRRSTGDNNISQRPGTAGSTLKPVLYGSEGEGQANVNAFRNENHVSHEQPVGDSRIWTPPPPPPNPSHVQVPLHLIYNPLHDQMMDFNRMSHRMFATEIPIFRADSYRTAAQVPFESIPQSPLDESFPPVSRYLTSSPDPRLVSPEGNLHPKISLLRTCGQCEAIPIDLLINNLHGIVKVNEGVYGEVYSGYYQNLEKASVYKVVAVEGSKVINGENQKRYSEIEPEIRVSQKLNSLRDPRGLHYTCGFCRLYRARLLEGRYPPVLVQAWNKWHEKNVSENECPNFHDGQRYVVFEYEYGGVDVEAFRFLDAEQAFALIIQVAFTLGAGETGCEFEHRDLHWGNILVQHTEDKEVKFKMNGVNCAVPTEGIKGTVIDFTISRSLDKENNPAFTDMANDEEQFMGTEGYQFEIYRMMREENENNWATFHPKSNIFWLHYLVDKLMKDGRYEKKQTEAHQVGLKKMKEFESTILDFGSCHEYALSHPKWIRPDD